MHGSFQNNATCVQAGSTIPPPCNQDYPRIRVLGTDMKRIVRIGGGLFGDRCFVRRRNVGEVVRAATNRNRIGAAAI